MGAISTGISQTFKVNPNGLERVTGKELQELNAASKATFLNTSLEESGRTELVGFDVTAETKESLVYDSPEPTTRKVIGAIQNWGALYTFGSMVYNGILWYKVIYNDQVGYLNGCTVEESKARIVSDTVKLTR